MTDIQAYILRTTEISSALVLSRMAKSSFSERIYRRKKKVPCFVFCCVSPKFYRMETTISENSITVDNQTGFFTLQNDNGDTVLLVGYQDLILPNVYNDVKVGVNSL